MQVIKDNGFEGRIKLIAKRSAELTVGPRTSLCSFILHVVFGSKLPAVSYFSLEWN